MLHTPSEVRHDEALASVAADLSHGPVRDLPAGTGSTTFAVASTGSRVDAVDPAPGLVGAGRSRCDDLAWTPRGPSATCNTSAACWTSREACPGAVSSFGMIFAPSPATTLREVASRLCPAASSR